MTISRRTFLEATMAMAVAPIAVAKATPRIELEFPRGFLWGTATSGHQIEGNNVNADAWLLENVEPTVYAEPSGDAANSFELWPQDLDLIMALGLNTYRFSLEWSRIEPEPGMFSVAMLDHYKAMIVGCLERGIKPMVTFNHFTTPRWFAARGAWTDVDAADIFARYCDRAARHLAADIAYATTLNEPNLIWLIRNGLSPETYAGFKAVIDAMYVQASRITGSTRFIAGNTINVDDIDGYTEKLIAAHKAGRAAIKAARTNLPVGVSLAMGDEHAVGEDSLRDEIRVRSYGAWLEAASEDDFLGVQNYGRTLWDANGTVEPPSGGDRNAAGDEVYPASLANVVRYASSVAQVPIIVTEHGVNTDDDTVRARLIPAALTELKMAMDDGVPVMGYMHWSLLDNFEWIFGYKYKYGLVAVDRATFERTPKPSASVYSEIARKNSLAEV